MRRRKLLIVVMGAVVLAGAVAWAYLWHIARPDQITRTNFDRVQVGMTLDEVKAILGPPTLEGNGKPPGPDGEVLVTWRSDDAISLVFFDRSGALDKFFSEFPLSQKMKHRLRRVFRLG